MVNEIIIFKKYIFKRRREERSGSFLTPVSGVGEVSRESGNQRLLICSLRKLHKSNKLI